MPPRGSNWGYVALGVCRRGCSAPFRPTRRRSGLAETIGDIKAFLA
jgi:hypothetical protein